MFLIKPQFFKIRGGKKMLSVGIIGGGKGGLSIIQLVEGMQDVLLKWVADLDENAPAIRRAREKGIKTTGDFTPLIRDSSLDMVIEVTGSDKVRSLIVENKHPGLAVIEATGARFLVDVVEQREEMIRRLHGEAETLSQNAETLNDNTAQIRESMEQLAGEAEKLAQTGREMGETAKEAARAISDTHNILNIIRDIADKTNIIGLNAAIEAARVGDAGRGFAVVADEIRKLADSSSSSVQQISDITENIVNFMEKIAEGISNASETAQAQAALTEEILASLEGTTSIAAVLKEMAAKLAKM
jgi:methyl-accepting chemotaxis protein